ncbi:MAG: FAD-dependent oxidoreductase [Chloroflexi bacterium]|nr:FAD-dependent oxidoreductase [Chloroflexota bacterium]
MSRTNITVYGATWCPDCKRAKKFLGEQMVHYDWVDIEKDVAARAYIEKINNGKRIIPTIVFADGSFLVEPTNAQLAQKLGLQTQAKMQFYDLIVVGGGPAGLTTAIYAAREGIETLVIEKSALGGQASITGAIDNFPGFPEGLSGAEFAERIVAQARRFGVEILQAQEVERIEATDDYRIIHLRDGSRYCAQAILVATGADYRKLNAQGEDDFIGAGIHFCATCDGPFYKGAEQIVVIGGGNSAVEEGLFLTKFAQRVTILVRGERLTASQFAQDKIFAMPSAVEVKFNTRVTEFRGKGKLQTIVTQNIATGVVEELYPDAAFIFIGQVPNNQIVREMVALDQWGYIKTGHDLVHHGERIERIPSFMETSARGIFAAGDVRAGSTKQVASAVGEGASAAISIREFLKGE